MPAKQETKQDANVKVVATKATKVDTEPTSKEFVKKVKKEVSEDGPVQVKKVEKKFLKNGKEDLSFLDASLPGAANKKGALKKK